VNTEKKRLKLQIIQPKKTGILFVISGKETRLNGIAAIIEH